MKRKPLLISFLVLAAFVVVAAFTWSSTTTIEVPDGMTTCADGSCGARPSWLAVAAGCIFWVFIVAAIGAAFLPFRHSRRELPFFFRAHIFVPCLFALWICAGSLFPFSPRQLVCTMPGFLLGADDWGVGNIYTYTKLADWLALLAGCAACGRLAIDRPTFASGFAKRFRLCQPHLIAAFVLHIGIFVCGLLDAIGIDEGLLFLWLLVGFAAIIALQALADSTRQWWPRLLSWFVAAGWLFVPVALFRP